MIRQAPSHRHCNGVKGCSSTSTEEEIDAKTFCLYIKRDRELTSVYLSPLMCNFQRHICVFKSSSSLARPPPQRHDDSPAKLCNVVPPMWHAATPVLAVANVLFGGRDPMILFSRKDFPVPEKHTFKKELKKQFFKSPKEKYHKCAMKGDLHQILLRKC